MRRERHNFSRAAKAHTLTKLSSWRFLASHRRRETPEGRIFHTHPV